MEFDVVLGTVKYSFANVIVEQDAKLRDEISTEYWKTIQQCDADENSISNMNVVQ